ncbi:MAG TPA: hypothetical protein VFO19_20850 [Vicinamibacterales bacterium]|nr:hypothetical protein [Vicinamibacterales bacterium]
MRKTLISIFAIVGWPIVVTAVLAVRASGGGVSWLEYVAWLLVAFAPAAAWRLIVVRRPSQSIAEILYDTEHRDEPAEVRRG